MGYFTPKKSSSSKSGNGGKIAIGIGTALITSFFTKKKMSKKVAPKSQQQIFYENEKLKGIQLSNEIKELKLQEQHAKFVLASKKLQIEKWEIVNIEIFHKHKKTFKEDEKRRNSHGDTSVSIPDENILWEVLFVSRKTGKRQYRFFSSKSKWGTKLQNGVIKLGWLGALPK